MANFFSLQDGSLLDPTIYGYSLTGAEMMNGISGIPLGIVDAYSPVFVGDGSPISAVAVHLSSRLANNTTDSLILKLSSSSGIRTEYYPISNFTAYDGSYNSISLFPQNWQILKLSAAYTLPNLSSAKISLAATNNNVISLIGNVTNNNFDKAVIGTDLTKVYTPYIITGVNAPTVGTQSPFGVGIDGSIQLNGSTQNILFSSYGAGNDFSNTDFTLEGWFYPTSTARQGLMGWNDDGADSYGISVLIESNTNYIFRTSNTGGSWWLSVDGGGSTANVWTHIAAVRNNGWIYFYINGISKGTPQYVGNTSLSKSASMTLKFGVFKPVINAWFGGYISNPRIARHALYQGNFTPPTAPFPNNVMDLLVYSYPYSTPYNVTKYLSMDNIHIGGSIKLSATEVRTVTADTYTKSNIYIHNKGTLTFPLTSSKTLTLNGSAGLQITSEGTLNIGALNSPVPLSATHSLIVNNSQIEVHNGGNLNVYGYPKLGTTYLISDTVSSSRTFTTTDSVSTSWLSGDTLVFTPNTIYKTGFDTLTLSSFIGSNTFTTSSASVYTHLGLSSLPYVPAISNLTRNVIISGNNPLLYGRLSANYNINNAIVGANNVPSITTATWRNNVIKSSLFLYPYNSYPTWKPTYVMALTGTDNNTNSGNVPGITLNGLSLGTNFTIEFWIYYIDGNWIIGNYNGFSSSMGDTAISVRNSGDPTTFTATNPKSMTNRWTHVAWVQNGSTLSIYFDGVFSNSGAATIPNDFSLNSLAQGSRGGIFALWSNIIVIANAAKYTGNFTPSVIPDYSVPSGGTMRVMIIPDPIYKYTNRIVNSVATVNTNFGGGSPVYFYNDISIDNTRIKNIEYSNNIIQNYTSLINLSSNNFIFNNNVLLSSTNNIGLSVSNVSGTVAMSGNVSLGNTNYGAYLLNNTITGTYGALGYNTTQQGTYLSGVNTGTIVGGGVNSAKEGIFVNLTTNILSAAYNLNSTFFQNIIASNNSSVGFRVSGNSVSASSAYLAPITLNINGLTASNNNDAAFEAYNIIGNISSVVANYNLSGIRTSIGNGPTTFDGLTSLNNNYVSLDTFNTTSNVYLTSNPSPFADGSDGSVTITSTGNSYYSKNNYILIPASSDYTIEFYIKLTSSSGDYEIFKISPTGSTGWSNANTNELLAYLGNFAVTLDGASNNNVKGLIYNTWLHIAYVRKSGVTTFFINGVSAYSASGTNSVYGNVSFGLPDSTGFTTANLIGSFSNLIISNSALYTTNNFAVPSATKPTPNPYVNKYVLQYPYTNLLVPNNISIFNILSAYNYNRTTIRNFLLSSNTLISTFGITMNSPRLSLFSLENSVISANNSFQLLASRNLIEGSYLINNCYMGPTPLGAGITNVYQPNAAKSLGFAFTNYNQIAGYNIGYFVAGSRMVDYTTNAPTANDKPTERLTPNSTTIKLKSSSKFLTVKAGDSVIVTVSVKKSTVANEGVAYNGNPPRLIAKRNPSMGLNNDVVLGVLDSTNDNPGSYVKLTGAITTPALDNGVYEFYVDCDGNNGGFINIDNWRQF